MMKNIMCQLLIVFLLTASSCKQEVKDDLYQSRNNQEYPSLILTKKGVEEIRSQLGKIPLFDTSLAKVKEEVDAEITLGIFVPVPKDLSGGYTHARHKKNWLILQKAGALYQILNDKKYAIYVRDMLLEYAKMYPTLPIHPQTRSYARGKLFWQCLNDANWLVYVSQAYDCIYNFLKEEERNILENDLFRPYANFLSEENPQFFNRVHNHSTWGNAAVGMIALVMNDDVLLQKALYGLKDVNINSEMKDNDGGFIKSKGQKVGFLANLDEPFSPDGYYTEGPYYQRYAMYPFLIFAQALQNKKPEFKILEYKNGVLLKAVNALLNLTDADGEFFPLNDAQKGMSYYSRELVTALDVAYHLGGNNPELLSIAEKQQRVTLDDAGMSVALGVKEGKSKPFIKRSIELRDGTEGDQGAIGILRQGNFELVYKYAAHGLSHGHFDKLSFSLFESGNEVIQDYGLVRFVNIEQKGGGNYLKENKTWAKQTISHNTLIQNETSHFKGKYKIGSKHHSEKYFFDADNGHIKIASAKEENAYPGTQLHRTMAIINDESYNTDFVLDILKITSNKKNNYDLPYYYLGQLLKTSFDYKAESTLIPLGNSAGYQHIYKEASGVTNDSTMSFNWLLNNKFYTITSANANDNELILGRIGANDPEFNLRKEPVLILRKKNTQNTVFVSIIESHGTYSPVSEFAINAYSTIKDIEIVYDDAVYTAIKITTNTMASKLFMLANQDNSEESTHKLRIHKKEYDWKGPYTLIKLK